MHPNQRPVICSQNKVLSKQIGSNFGEGYSRQQLPLCQIEVRVCYDSGMQRDQMSIEAARIMTSCSVVHCSRYRHQNIDGLRRHCGCESVAEHPKPSLQSQSSLSSSFRSQRQLVPSPYQYWMIGHLLNCAVPKPSPWATTLFSGVQAEPIPEPDDGVRPRILHAGYCSSGSSWR